MSYLAEYLNQHRQQFEEELFELLRIESISTDSKYAGSVRDAADWVAKRLQGIGLATEVIPTSGHPIVYAESPAVANAPTVLIYGHYDVQPADPLEKWDTPPFEPTVKNGNVVARGATDDKGQMYTHIASTAAWMATSGKLPVQLKFLIEGEEECGSEGLDEFLTGKLDGGGVPVMERLKADIAVISDSSQFGPGQPAITYGLKGIAYFELRLRGPKRDLHSGTFGGAVMNPANALSQMLATLVDSEGRVQVPGFYDDVIELADAEREQFASLPFSDEDFAHKVGVGQLFGEAGYSTLERRWARPTCDINGLTSGYQGEGAKTVLPSEASAKFSFRLVPDQSPEKIRVALTQFLEERCPPGIEMQLEYIHGAPGVVVSLDSPYMSAAANAIEHGFGTRPVFIREGGSIPVVTAFREQLGIDTLLLGWGLDDDNTHSPNEKFSLEDFHRGIKASAHLWEEIGQLVND